MEKEKILVGRNEQDKIEFICFQGKPYPIDDKEPYIKQLKAIEADRPNLNFLKTFNEPGSTETVRKGSKEYEKYKIMLKERQTIEQKLNDKIHAKNIKVYTNSINKCFEDVATGVQIKLMHTNYQIDNDLFATSDIGKSRNNQQDSVLIMNHPLNHDFKLLAVSDGVGGSQGGELVSNHLLKKLGIWFQNLEPKSYENLEKIKEPLNNILKIILQDKNLPKNAAATLSLVIVGKNNTLITNIGDSGVYTMKDDSINKETKDDSYVQLLFDNGNIKSEALMPFHKKSNIVTQVVSKDSDYNPNFKVIPNTNYDLIFAATDGVTDVIPEESLKNIIQNSKKEQITSRIIEKTNTEDNDLIETLNSLSKEELKKAEYDLKAQGDSYYHDIPGGKDNATVAAFIKK